MNLDLKIIAVTLSTIILLNSTLVSITYTYYNLDPIGFIENLCINKETPELQCNGKCQLMSVSGVNDEQNNKPEAIFEYKEINLFNIIQSDSSLCNFYAKKPLILFYYINNYYFLNNFKSYHPPQFS